MDSVLMSTLTWKTGSQKQKRSILLEEKHESFIAAVRKWEMLAASKVKMSGSEKNKSEQEHIQHFLNKTCN